ncbi:MAG: class E sortase [Oscillospiraceae bacterium]|nr:class E sortase [Oscillospiraceae bacterium]
MKRKWWSRLLLAVGGALILASALFSLWRDYQYSQLPQSGAVGFGELPAGKLVITTQRKNYQAQELTLSIPKLGLETAVQDGTDYETLKKGPGLYEYAQLPNEEEPGNVSIAGHRDIFGSHFYSIDTLTKGDLIYLIYQGKLYTYEYAETRIVEPNDWSVIENQGHACVTLTSCDPIGTTEKRIIATGELVKVDNFDEKCELISSKEA